MHEMQLLLPFIWPVQIREQQRLCLPIRPALPPAPPNEATLTNDELKYFVMAQS